MNTEVATIENKSSALGEVAVTQDQVALIKNTVAVGATDDELKLFFFECRRRGVHPMDRLIHFVKRQGKAAFQCSIDFMRMQAEDTGLYRGQDEPEYGADVNGHPEWARVVVHKKDPDTGDVYPNPAKAYWTEFYPGDAQGFMWKKMPRLMLGKVAEAQALRKAFPRQFNNLYTFDEMQQADIVASGTPKAGQGKPPVKQPAEKKAPAESNGDARMKLAQELESFCSGDIEMMNDVCHQVSAFGTNNGFTVADIMAQREDESWKISDKWIQTSLGNLRKMAEGKQE